MKAATLKKWSFRQHQEISIHAAREGGDQIFSVVTPVMPISIHAAREGGDRLVLLPKVLFTEFQSTPPVKAATVQTLKTPTCEEHFNPRRP